VAPDGTLTRAQSFDVYGCVRTSSGAATTKHKFVGALGHPSDDETGLIYMRARHYDPVCGRSASEDPGQDGVNWFTYCSAGRSSMLTRLACSTLCTTSSRCLDGSSD
jgi:RHS repeat-associated protein